MVITPETRRLYSGAGIIAIGLLVAAAVPAARGQETGIAADQAARAVNESNRLFDLGEYADAIAAGKSALREQPENAIAYNNIAVSYASLGQWDQAIEKIKTAIRLQPGFQLALNNLEWFLRAKASPIDVAGVNKDAADWLNLSLGYYQGHRYPESLSAAQEALRLKTDMAEADNNIAAAYASMGRWEEAAQAAREAIRLKPDLQLARNNLAWAEAEMQKPGGGSGR